MVRYNNVKVFTYSKKVNISEIGPDFQFFDTTVTHREGNYVTVVGHEYYRPSYRTKFRRPGRKTSRNTNKDKDEENDDSGRDANVSIQEAFHQSSPRNAPTQPLNNINTNEANS